MPRLLVPLVLVVSLSLPAAAAIVAGPEQELTVPVVEPPASAQSRGRIATDGDTCLAVWTEGGRSTNAIHATRLTAGGERVDDVPLVVSDSPAGENEPDLAWGGGRYLVVWSTGSRIEGRFVDPEGSMTDVITIATATMYTHVSRPRVAFNGHAFLVAWNDSVTVRGALIDRNGGVVKTTTIATASYAPEVVVAAADGVFYVAFWGYEPVAGSLRAAVFVARVFEGSEIARPILLAATPSSVTDLSIAARGSEVLVAWTAWTAETANAKEIRSARLTGGAASAVESIPAGAFLLDTVVADRTGFVLIYGNETERHALRDGSSFSVATPSHPSRVVAAASGAAGPVLLTLDVRALDLYAQPLGQATFEPLAVAARHQSSPEIAAAGAISLAVWQEVIPQEHRTALVAQRLGAGGDPLDPGPFELASHRVPPGLRQRIASNGNEWLVVWQESGRLVGMRVSPFGRLLDPETILITDYTFYGAEHEVAWDGAAYTVVYLKGTISRFGSNFTVLYTRVHPDGRVDPGDTMLSDNRSNAGPAIASNGTASLVVWTETKEHVLRGVLLGRSGSITPIAFPAIPAQAGAAVAWNGRTFLVAVPIVGDEIHWVSVSATGVVTEAPAWVPGSTGLDRPVVRLAANGDGFLLAWKHEGELRAARIHRSGFLDAPATTVARIATAERMFGLGGTRVVYARPADPLRDQLTRVFAREVAIVPNPPKRRAVR